MSIAGVTRELLVRYLDVWTPAALHARRATVVCAGPSGADAGEAALRVFAEFADRLRGRQLTLVVVTGQGAADPAAAPPGPGSRLDAVRAELGIPPELAVHSVHGPIEHLPAVLTAAGATKAPLLAFLDTAQAPPRAVIAAVAAGRPAELLLTTAAEGWDAHRDLLRSGGFPLTAGVELVDTTAGSDGTGARLLAFATSHDKNLEAFKNALWSVDEYAGVRFRDPADPDGHLLDISLKPHPGPLRRELLAHLTATGGRTVTELRRFTLTSTVYRSSDTTSALTSLLTAGTVDRSPPTGRLSGDVRISVAGARPA